MAITVCMLCFESPALPWQALANCSSRRANSSAQPSRCAINGQSFQDVQNFKQNCRLVRRILISGADKTESETKITWALGPSLANLASRLLWASTHFSTWKTFFATIFSHPASTWASNPPGELCILDLSESSMSWFQCLRKDLLRCKKNVFHNWRYQWYHSL